MLSEIVTVWNLDNKEFLRTLNPTYRWDIMYADYMYENLDFSWVDSALPHLADNGVFIAQTDWHSVAEFKVYMKQFKDMQLLNWCIYINEWGGTPAKGFGKKHDDILIYTKGNYFTWNPEKIRIPKATAGTAFDKKGTGLKVPCDVFYDKVSFSTVSKERIKFEGKCFKYQKPQWLYDRIIAPFVNEYSSVLDIFMGSGTLGKWCMANNVLYTGIELDTEVFNLAKQVLGMSS